jgi:hypothetical protein
MIDGVGRDRGMNDEPGMHRNGGSASNPSYSRETCEKSGTSETGESSGFSDLRTAPCPLASPQLRG